MKPIPLHIRATFGGALLCCAKGLFVRASLLAGFRLVLSLQQNPPRTPDAVRIAAAGSFHGADAQAVDRWRLFRNETSAQRLQESAIGAI